MLRTRVIPIVLIDGYSVVKTIRFDERRNQGNPIAVARIYNTRNVDELVLLDIDASVQNRSIDLLTIEEIASECFMPLTVGGGIRSLQDIRQVLDCGADKVAINTAAIENPSFVDDAVRMFGAQCIVGSVDVQIVGSEYKVFSRGSATSIGALDWMTELVSRGVGELLVNSVDQDGTMSGCDLKLIGVMSGRFSVPVVYAGGVKDPVDCIEPIQKGCSAVAAASIFHFTRYTPSDIKSQLRIAGIPVRL